MKAGFTEQEAMQGTLSGFRTKGFSLIELLVVIGVIVLLASILFAALHSARLASMKAKTLSQFSQWIAAIEGFRQEYGYYPFVTGSGDTAFGINQSAANRKLFEEVLNGVDRVRNPKGIPFYRLTEDDLLDPSTPQSPIVDGFGNPNILVLIDGNGDGVIEAGSYSGIRRSLAVVASAEESQGFPEVSTWSTR
jgi:prepilin-type N-terminal cleavage/methylation domain-containing protein